MWSTMKEVRSEPPPAHQRAIISSYDAKMLEIAQNPSEIALWEHVWGDFYVGQGERLDE